MTPATRTTLLAALVGAAMLGVNYCQLKRAACS
jgi:hypothetical protein